MLTSTRLTLLFLCLALAASLSSPPLAASQEPDVPCVCPVDPAGFGPDPELTPDQTQGSEPSDFEFESEGDRFDQEQTDGDEPDDFEFESHD